MPDPIPFVLAVEDHGAGGHSYGLVTPVQWETLIWAWIIFALLFLILRKFAWKPLLHAVEEREKKIADSLARAEEIQRSAQEIAARQEAALAESQAQAKAVLDEARVAAERYRHGEMQKTKAESDAFLERAKKEMTLEEARARDALRREVVDLTLQAASQVIERSLTAADDRKLAEGVVQALQKGRVGAARN